MTKRLYIRAKDKYFPVNSLSPRNLGMLRWWVELFATSSFRVLINPKRNLSEESVSLCPKEQVHLRLQGI